MAHKRNHRVALHIIVHGRDPICNRPDSTEVPDQLLNTVLFQFDLGANLFELGLGCLGIIFRQAFLDSHRSAFD